MILARIDASRLQAAIREHLKLTSRSTADALNARMQAVLMRTYMLLPPRDPQAERNRLKAELTRELEQRGRVLQTGRGKGQFKRWGKSRQYQFRHRLVQAKERFSGSDMGKKIKRAAGRMLRTRLSAVGYVKGLCIYALRQINGGRFSQFGGTRGKSAVAQWRPNAMMVRLAAEYNHAVSGNVAVNPKGYRGSVRPAVDGAISPRVTVDVASLATNKTTDRVATLYANAAQQAANHEADELVRHITHLQRASASQAGFIVP